MRPDVHAPRSGLNSHRRMNEQLTTSRIGCRACVLGRGRNRYHHRIDGRGDIVQIIALDYMFFTDYGVARALEEAEERTQQNNGNVRDVQTVLVMKDYAQGSIWAYLVAGEGLAAAPQLVEMILHDLDACGLGSALLVTKADQEPAIIEVQAGISRLRRDIVTDGTAEENSGGRSIVQRPC